MQRAATVLAKLKLASHGVTDEQLARAAWPVSVGKTIANHTNAVALVRTRLVIDVEDSLWQRQLFGLRDQILRRLEESLGKRIVDELEFRVAVPRRKPEAALTHNGVILDEADGIRDFVLRSIYKSARKKASA